MPPYQQESVFSLKLGFHIVSAYWYGCNKHINTHSLWKEILCKITLYTNIQLIRIFMQIKLPQF